MSTRKWDIDVEVVGRLVIDERHMAMMMSPEWQASYYKFTDEFAAVDYVTRCLIRFGRLDGLDGHANLPDDWEETRFDEAEMGVIAWKEDTR